MGQTRRRSIIELLLRLFLTGLYWLSITLRESPADRHVVEQRANLCQGF